MAGDPMLASTPKRAGSKKSGSRSVASSQKTRRAGKRVEQTHRDDHFWEQKPAAGKADERESREFKEMKDKEIFSNTRVKKFDRNPLQQAVVDEIVFGYDIDRDGGTTEAAGLDLSHLEGRAGKISWGKENKLTRYHVRDPAAPYTLGKTRIHTGPMAMSTVKYEAFGDELDPRLDVKDQSDYRKKYEGAFGTFSDDPSNAKKGKLGHGKKLFRNAPQTKTTVDKMMLSNQATTSSAQLMAQLQMADFDKEMEGGAGAAKKNWIHQKDRFTACETRQFGKKILKGAPSSEDHVSSRVFSTEDKGCSKEDKEAYRQNLLQMLGNPGWGHRVPGVGRFHQLIEEDHGRCGKRMYANAPQMSTAVDEVGFNVNVYDKNSVPGSYEWNQVIAGCAGLGYNRKADMIHGRYHLDEDHADGHIAGRRQYGTPYTDAVVRQSESSLSSGSSVGKPTRRFADWAMHKEDETTNLAMFQPPSRRATSQASRRGVTPEYRETDHEKVNRHRNPYSARQMKKALHLRPQSDDQDTEASEEELTPRRAKSARRAQSAREKYRSPLPSTKVSTPASELAASSSSKKIGSTGRTIYDRDYYQNPKTAYEDAFKQPPPPYFYAPERSHAPGHWDNEKVLARSGGRPGMVTGTPSTTAASLAVPPLSLSTLQRSSSLREAKTKGSSEDSRESRRTQSSRGETKADQVGRRGKHKSGGIGRPGSASTLSSNGSKRSKGSARRPVGSSRPTQPEPPPR